MALSREGERLLAGLGQVDLVVAGPQVGGEGTADLTFVVDDEDPGHGATVPRSASSSMVAVSAATGSDSVTVRPPPRGVVEHQLSCHRLDEPLRDGETETDSGRAVVAEALERIEHPVADRRRGCRDPVDDPDDGPVADRRVSIRTAASGAW